MFNYYNPHPDNKNVGDCVKRALTKASGKSYRDVSNELNRLKRSIGASAYNVKSVWDKYLREDLCATYQSFPAVKGQSRMTVKRFCEEYPEGTYVLNVARHMVCCEDGEFYDTWDCSDKCVYGAYEVSKIPTMEEICASPAPKMMPMPGIEKLADLKKEYTFDGHDIIREMAEVIRKYTQIKKTRRGELWISLDTDQDYTSIFNLLHDGMQYEHFVWETKRSKSYIRDTKTGMELILKRGKGAYLWCTERGSN